MTAQGAHGHRVVRPDGSVHRIDGVGHAPGTPVGLAAWAASLGGSPVREVVERVTAALASASGGDDVTVLGLRRTG